MSTKKKDALASLGAFIRDHRQISVGGKLFDLAKLRPIDLAAARNYVVQKRIERHVNTTRGMPFDPVTRSKTLAEIECYPTSLWDVAQDPDGRIKLIHLSLTLAGAQMTLVGLEQSLDPQMQDELYAFVMWISGLVADPTEESEADPTTVSDGT